MWHYLEPFEFRTEKQMNNNYTKGIKGSTLLSSMQRTLVPLHVALLCIMLSLKVPLLILWGTV